MEHEKEVIKKLSDQLRTVKNKFDIQKQDLEILYKASMIKVTEDFKKTGLLEDNIVGIIRNSIDNSL